MDEQTCAQESAAPVGDLGGRFMLDPATLGASASVGLDPMGFYLVGRFGPLGTRSADEVIAAAVFIEPDGLKEVWGQAVTEDTDLHKVAETYLQCCADWGRANLLTASGLEEFSSLAQMVVESVDAPPHASLYGSIKAMGFPDDKEGKTMVLAHTLRELRFAHHVKALREEGMSPLTAILADSGGEGNAKMFMWKEPFEEITDEISVRRQKIGENTDEYSAGDFSALSDSQRQELVDSAKQILSSL